MPSLVKVFVIIFLAVALLLTACAETARDFEDVPWLLESYGEPGNLKTVLPDTEITATFDSADGKVTGIAGCNNYFAGYRVKGNKLTVPGPIARTEMWCGDEIGKQETQYLNTLQAAESYTIQNGSLHITCADQLLVFKRR